MRGRFICRSPLRPFPGIECRPSPSSIMPDVIRLRAVYRFAGTPSLLPSAAPVRPRVRHTRVILHKAAEDAVPPARPQCGCSPCGARMSIMPDVIRLRAVYLRCCFVLASMRRIFMCGISFFHNLFAYLIFLLYLCIELTHRP